MQETYHVGIVGNQILQQRILNISLDYPFVIVITYFSYKVSELDSLTNVRSVKEKNMIKYNGNSLKF